MAATVPTPLYMMLIGVLYHQVDYIWQGYFSVIYTWGPESQQYVEYLVFSLSQQRQPIWQTQHFTLHTGDNPRSDCQNPLALEPNLLMVWVLFTPLILVWLHGLDNRASDIDSTFLFPATLWSGLFTQFQFTSPCDRCFVVVSTYRKAFKKRT